MAYLRTLILMAIPCTPSQSLVWLAGLALLSGCPANRKMSVPPGAPARVADTPPAVPAVPSTLPEAFMPTPVPEVPQTPATSEGSILSGTIELLPNGEACTESATCESGVCEGGCDEANPSVCMSTERPCSLELVTFCSCEGETFRARSVCVGRRYRSRGACE